MKAILQVFPITVRHECDQSPLYCTSGNKLPAQQQAALVYAHNRPFIKSTYSAEPKRLISHTSSPHHPTPLPNESKSYRESSWDACKCIRNEKEWSKHKGDERDGKKSDGMCESPVVNPEGLGGAPSVFSRAALSRLNGSQQVWTEPSPSLRQSPFAHRPDKTPPPLSLFLSLSEEPLCAALALLSRALSL